MNWEEAFSSKYVIIYALVFGIVILSILSELIFKNLGIGFVAYPFFEILDDKGKLRINWRKRLFWGLIGYLGAATLIIVLFELFPQTFQSIFT